MCASSPTPVRSRARSEVFGGMMPASCLYASADYVQNHPNTVQALTNAVVQGAQVVANGRAKRPDQGRSRCLSVGRPRAVPGVVRQDPRIDRARRRDPRRWRSRTRRASSARLEPSRNVDKLDLDRLVHQHLRAQGEGEVSRLSRQPACARSSTSSRQLDRLCVCCGRAMLAARAAHRRVAGPGTRRQVKRDPLPGFEHRRCRDLVPVGDAAGGHLVTACQCRDRVALAAP